MRKSTIILIATSIGLIIMCIVSSVLLHYVEPRGKKLDDNKNTTTTTPPTSATGDAPASEPVDKPADVPADKPADVPADVPADKPADVPADKPADEPAKARAGFKLNPVRLSLNDFNASGVINIIQPTTVKHNTTTVDNPESNGKAVIFKFIDERGIPKFELKINDNIDPQQSMQLQKTRRLKVGQDNNREVVLNMYNTHIALDDYDGEPKPYNTSPFNIISNDNENTNQTQTTKAFHQIQNMDPYNDRFEYDNLNLTGIVTALKTMKDKIMKMYSMLPSNKNEQSETKSKNKRNSSTKFFPDTSNDHFNDTIISQVLFDKKPIDSLNNNTSVLNNFVSFFSDIAKDDIVMV